MLLKHLLYLLMQLQNEMQMNCRFPSLKPGQTKHVDIIFDLRESDNLTAGEVDLAMNVKSKCSSGTQNPDHNMISQTELMIVYESKLPILPQNVHKNRIEYDKENVNFVHEYKITNLGPSPTRNEKGYRVIIDIVH